MLLSIFFCCGFVFFVVCFCNGGVEAYSGLFLTFWGYFNCFCAVSGFVVGFCLQFLLVFLPEFVSFYCMWVGVSFFFIFPVL